MWPWAQQGFSFGGRITTWHAIGRQNVLWSAVWFGWFALGPRSLDFVAPPFIHKHPVAFHQPLSSCRPYLCPQTAMRHFKPPEPSGVPPASTGLAMAQA